MTMTTKQARAWMRKNAAALLQIALDEEHGWIWKGPDGKILNEFSQRRVERVVRDFIRRNG
jgi:hypothetical protein